MNDRFEECDSYSEDLFEQVDKNVAFPRFIFKIAIYEVKCTGTHISNGTSYPVAWTRRLKAFGFAELAN